MMDVDYETKENKLAAQIQQQISEDLQKDERLRHFVCEMTEDEKWEAARRFHEFWENKERMEAKNGQ